MDKKLKAIQQITNILKKLDAEDRGIVVGYVQQQATIDLYRHERARKDPYVGGEGDASTQGPGHSLLAEGRY